MEDGWMPLVFNGITNVTSGTFRYQTIKGTCGDTDVRIYVADYTMKQGRLYYLRTTAPDRYEVCELAVRFDNDIRTRVFEGFSSLALLRQTVMIEK
jgi:hypothetical protein